MTKRHAHNQPIALCDHKMVGKGRNSRHFTYLAINCGGAVLLLVLSMNVRKEMPILVHDDSA